MSETKYTWDMLSDVHKEILTIVNEMLQSDDERFTASRFYPGLGGREAIMRREFQTLADEGYFNYDPFDAVYQFTKAGLDFVANAQLEIADETHDIEAADDEPAYNPATNWITKPAADAQREVEDGWQAAEDLIVEDARSVIEHINDIEFLRKAAIAYHDNCKAQAAEIERLLAVNVPAADVPSAAEDKSLVELRDIVNRIVMTDDNVVNAWGKDLREALPAFVSQQAAEIERLQAANVALTTRNRALQERAEKAEAERDAARAALENEINALKHISGRELSLEDAAERAARRSQWLREFSQRARTFWEEKPRPEMEKRLADLLRDLITS